MKPGSGIPAFPVPGPDRVSSATISCFLPISSSKEHNTLTSKFKFTPTVLLFSVPNFGIMFIRNFVPTCFFLSKIFFEPKVHLGSFSLFLFVFFVSICVSLLISCSYLFPSLSARRKN
ncbi:unnamed protein product [Meloidogyne enterolobii]|uniref:Uncharacterized protein n=1 Tax=Meloidogyne enterolobii TaxID=390850 RepID=A0ACB0XTX8_MELEN